MRFVNRRVVNCKTRQLVDGRSGGDQRLTDFPVLDRTPLEALDVQAEAQEGREDNNGLNTSLLPLVVLRLSSPAEELNNVFSHLGGGGGSA